MAGDRDIVIVEVTMPPADVVLFQGLLAGEEGVATIRCLDSERRRQQLWTTPSQLPELKRWLASLPESVRVEPVDEFLWSGERDEG